MSVGALGLFAMIITGGVALGFLLAVIRPRDPQTAETHRALARRAAGWLRRLPLLMDVRAPVRIHDPAHDD